MTSFKGRLIAGVSVLVFGFLLSLATAQSPDPRPGATQPVREQNLDAAGAIRVHEQGVADVSVTNDSLAVVGTVDVANFPTKFDVNVTGGKVAITATPAEGVFVDAYNVAEDTTIEVPLPSTLTAWTLHAHSHDNSEVVVEFLRFLFQIFTMGNEHFGALGDGKFVTLTKPVELDGLRIRCSNSLTSCNVRVTIIGE